MGNLGIDFKEVKRLISVIMKLGADYEAVYENKPLQEERIKEVCKDVMLSEAEKTLSKVPVEELKKSKAGIRVSLLAEAGYTDLYKLSQAKDWEIANIPGIGDKQLEAIRNIITEFINKISDYTNIRLSPEEYDHKSVYRELIRNIYYYKQCEVIREEGTGVREELREYIEHLNGEKVIKNRLMWIFSNRRVKENTLSVLSDMIEFCDGNLYKRVLHFLEAYRECMSADEDTVRKDYEYNSADYYAILDALDAGGERRALIYGSIPARLADTIDRTALALADINGKLRAYQEFGVKYIINQHRVLLGDEMGLGKTIQAIAAMVHLNNEAPGAHFLVICPASVLINWCREIRKFSKLLPYFVHGDTWEEQMDKWKKTGGVAVTNYEMMGKIVKHVDGRMVLKLLIVDEAHYIKNPDALRTGYVRRLEDEAENILLMTGTPLENKVEEMCSLIDFIRPEMSKDIRNIVKMSGTAQFKEMLAPLYLRRTREQVLKELPDIEDKQEWCEMTESDRELYVEALKIRDITGMRRVSFMQPDPLLSSKGRRLIELCTQAGEEGRKVIVYSFYLDTIDFALKVLKDKCIGVICGDTPIRERQNMIDRLKDAKEGSVIIAQIQSGGTGLNIQSASIVIFLEPQIKPSLENQAVSRVYRMGQIRNVLVYHLLCEDTIDEAMVERLRIKQEEFNEYAEESAIAEACDNLLDRKWINEFVEKERNKYLPMIV
ncbi:MAG: DEAD/DEAH box helicase [Lachnospiraceae bacterium]|nr:DEAD/DEAH box helicase [Lachnospiraceae bacterium]